jgi:hypothetical protein
MSDQDDSLTPKPMIEYEGCLIRTKRVDDADQPWMSLIGWVGCIFAWRAVYGTNEHDVIEQAKTMIDKEMRT